MRIDKTIPMNGRVIVEPIKSETDDHSLGIKLAVDAYDTLLATIVKSYDPVVYPEGAVIMYDRIHGKDIELEDENGVVKTYKVVIESDISLMQIKDDE